MKNSLIYIIIIVAFGCKNNRTLPSPININTLNETEFVPTLENNFSNTKNTIYAPSLLFAWNEIKNNLSQLIVNKSDTELQMINNSKSFVNSLKNNELNNSISINNNEISASSTFKIELNFKPELQQYSKPFLFFNEKVEAFGMELYNHEIANNIEIIYFKDNDNFIFKQKTTDTTNELIFIKGLINTNTFANVLKEYYHLTQIGKIEKNNENLAWKFSLKEDEVYLIPKINFNIEKNYENLLNKTLLSNGQEYKIKKAYQRTGFLLDEKGAIVESEAEVSCDAAASNISENEIMKYLILDKPFFIIIKHNNTDNPYFVMKVNNSELMVK